MSISLLTENHYRILKDRAISDEFIVARGVRSVEADEAVEKYGFSPWQRFSGLLIPTWGMDREIKGCQIRPDRPRIDKKGRPIKYESPWKQRNALDMNPLMQEVIRKMDTAIWITEGSLKGDSMGSRGFPAIALTGVWGWRGRNEAGGYTALPDWEDVSIRGSRFVIAFDSDISTNKQVAESARRLKDYLLYKKADLVKFLILPSRGTEKVGVDDYLASISKGR